MRVLPPILFLAAAATMAVADRWLPGPEIVGGPLRLAGVPVGLAGALLLATAAHRFHSTGTNLRPFGDPNRLVTDGPWRFSRNPIYLGLVVMLLGGAILAGTLSSFVPVLAFWFAADRCYVRFEEAALARTFGADWEAYRVRVRRWF